MAGLFAISIDPRNYRADFLEDLFWGTFYQQHLGEAYAGLSTCEKGKILIRTHRGLFRPTFAQDLGGLEGTEGIGYCGLVREPYFVDSRLGKMSLCFSGNIINLEELVSRFKNFGHTFERGDDIEMIAKHIAQGNSIIDGIAKIREIRGAYSLLILSQEGIFATRVGPWPLVIGEKKGAVVIASESSGFANLGFKPAYELKPGEIVFLKNGLWQTKERLTIEEEQRRICSFLYVYTAFPGAVFERIPSSLVRKRLGAALARQDIEQGFIPDIVVPVPDSGRFCAIGYHQEFCRQMTEGRIAKIPFYDEILLKYPYAGRSFTPQSQEERELEAQIKLLESGESYDNKVVVVCDDSIVRGTQVQKDLVPKLRGLGIREIHFRISNPELYFYCPWGKTTQQGEVLASRIPSLPERIEYLKIDSLIHNTVEGLMKAIGLPAETLCIDCNLGLPA